MFERPDAIRISTVAVLLERRSAKDLRERPILRPRQMARVHAAGGFETTTVLPLNCESAIELAYVVRLNPAAYHVLDMAFDQGDAARSLARGATGISRDDRHAVWIFRRVWASAGV